MFIREVLICPRKQSKGENCTAMTKLNGNHGGAMWETLRKFPSTTDAILRTYRRSGVALAKRVTLFRYCTFLFWFVPQMANKDLQRLPAAGSIEWLPKAQARSHGPIYYASTKTFISGSFIANTRTWSTFELNYSAKSCVQTARQFSWWPSLRRWATSFIRLHKWTSLRFRKSTICASTPI